MTVLFASRHDAARRLAVELAQYRGRNPLVCAIPVAAPDSLERVRPYADELVCMEAPSDFYAVGQFYSEFRQVEDEEVIELLAKTSRAVRRADVRRRGERP